MVTLRGRYFRGTMQIHHSHARCHFIILASSWFHSIELSFLLIQIYRAYQIGTRGFGTMLLRDPGDLYAEHDNRRHGRIWQYDRTVCLETRSVMGSLGALAAHKIEQQGIVLKTTWCSRLFLLALSVHAHWMYINIVLPVRYMPRSEI